MDIVTADRAQRLAKYHRHMGWLEAKRMKEQEVRASKQVKVAEGHVHDDPIYMDNLINYMTIKPEQLSPQERPKHQHIGLDPAGAQQAVRDIVHGKIDNSANFERIQQLALVVPGFV